MPGLWFLPAPVSFALLRHSVCPLPRSLPTGSIPIPIPIPVPIPSPSRSTPLRVPARREASTGCQAGAGLPSHGTGLRDRRLPPVGRAIPAGLGSTSGETANEGQGLLSPTPPSAPLQGKDGFSSFSHVGRETRFPGAV